MVILKEYEAYLKVKRFIDGHDESEIISSLMGDNKYVHLIIKSDDADPIKYYSTSAAATRAKPAVNKRAGVNKCMVWTELFPATKWGVLIVKAFSFSPANLESLSFVSQYSQ